MRDWRKLPYAKWRQHHTNGKKKRSFRKKIPTILLLIQFLSVFAIGFLFWFISFK